MVAKFSAETNKVYLMEQRTLLHILKGKGSIEVDFKKYHDWQDKIIFLDKGQYVKFIGDEFVVRKIDFEDKDLFYKKDVRVLFKHLVSLGYINFDECSACHAYLLDTVFSDQVSDIIDVSSKQWFWQNPFNANKEEYHLIFDVKDIIDEQFYNHLSNDELSRLIRSRGYHAQALFQEKVGVSVKKMMGQKRLVEGQRQIAFSDKSIREISFELGYKDPAYFNRVFKQTTGQKPTEFRTNFEYGDRDLFLQDLYNLLGQYHQTQRNTQFYADKMYLSVKTLSRKVKEKLNITLGQLIRTELINTSKELLVQAATVREVAYALGFEEANHFSAFFKQYTGKSPMEYKNEKVQ